MMKNTKIHLYALFIAIILLCGCYSKRPIVREISEPDYNSRVTVSEARYVKRKNILGFTLNIGIVGAGAYGGYMLSPFNKQDGMERTPIHSLNVGAGMLVGAGVVLLTDFIMGKNTYHEIIGDNPQKWINKVNKDYKFLSGTNSDFTMINPDIEDEFQVSNIKDVEDFKNAFNNSQYTTKIVTNAAKNLYREELPELIKLYPTNRAVINAKTRYVQESNSVDDIVDSDRLYPETKLDIETMAFNKTLKSDNIYEHFRFFKFFPNSTRTTEVFKHGLKLIQKEKNYHDFLKSTPPTVDSTVLKEAQWAYIKSFEAIDSIADAYYRFPNAVDKATVLNKLNYRGSINTISDLKKIKERFGYVNGVTEKIVKKVKSSTDTMLYYKIWDIFPELDSNLQETLYADYIFYIKNSLYASSNNLEKLTSWISKHKGLPITEELRAYCDYKYEYLYLKKYYYYKMQKCAEFVKKYPKDFKEIDKLAFKNVDSYDSKSAREYLYYFPNGKYRKEAQKKLRIGKANEEKRKDDKCYTCHGNGKCESCNGRGTIICSKCSGTGRSSDWDACSYCRASGQMRCGQCSGNGRCSHCKGSGYQNR